MKTICFVVPYFPAASHTFVINHIVAAKQQGYRIKILTYKLKALEDSSQDTLIHKYGLLEDTILIDYKQPQTKFKQLIFGFILLVRFFKFWSKPTGLSFKHRLLNSPYLINFYKDFKEIDVFHVHFALNGTAIAEMKANGLLRGTLITTFHGHDAHFKSDEEMNHLKNAYRLLFKTSHYVTVNTPYLGNQVLLLGCKDEQLEIIPMGIDIAYFKSFSVKQIPSDGVVKLISVGRLIELKGFGYSLRTVKLLVNLGVQVFYTIIGDGPLYKTLQKQIIDLGLENFVKLVGRQSQDNIKNLLDSHHIYLMSSITDANGRAEAQGVVSAEAQAMGLPVVAFNSGGVPYTIDDGKTGFLVKEGDVKHYAKIIFELIQEPQKYLRMSEQARNYAVANFSFELMFKRFEGLYLELDNF